MDKDFEKTKQAVKVELADYLGIDIEDVEDDSVLTEDLHMKATDLTDFGELLSSKNYDTASLDFSQVETFLDLVEAVTAKE